MSETEVKIEAVLDKFEDDVATVRDEINILASPVSIDSISATKPDSHKPVPYAMTAYALSSLLFAYLRSEGKDTALVMPELGRVKDKMEKLSQQLQNIKQETTKESQRDLKKESKKDSRKKRSVSPIGNSTKVSKHTRFEDATKDKPRKKNKKAKTEKAN